MKILHTSDWHLGQSFHGYDRSEEQRDVLRQICAIAREEDVDAVVVCGDVFHNSQPSAQAQRLFSDALVAMRRALRPEARIVVTAGNHDSPSRLEAMASAWRELGVTVTGTAMHRAPEEFVTEIKDRGIIAGVPFVSAHSVDDDFYSRVTAAAAAIDAGRGLPVVLTAHTTVSGCRRDGHQGATEKTTGGIDSVSQDSFGTDFDYLALGHIHVGHTLRPPVGASFRARYCGTPAAVSFDETFPHSVSIVEIARRGAEPCISEREISQPCPLINIPAHGTAKWDEALALLEALPEDVEGYVRLNVATDGYLPFDASDAIERATAGKRCRFCTIAATRAGAGGDDDGCGDATDMTIDEFRRMEPLELAIRYADDTGTEFPDELRELFAATAEKCRHGSKD